MAKKCNLLSEWINTAESLSRDDRDHRMEFWGHELRRTWSFLMDHEDEYIALLHETSRLENLPGAAPRTQETEESLSRRQLISAAIGYFEFIQQKLDQLRSLRQNSYFIRA